MGTLLRSVATLLDKEAVSSASTVGTDHLLRPASDSVPDRLQDFAVQFILTGSSMTSATVIAKVQTSWDNINWIDIATSTTLNADGNITEIKPTADHIGPYVRASVAITGTVTYDAKVLLISDARFTLGTVS